jgi:hypothetical protein
VSARSLLTGALLLFVAAGVAVLAFKEFRGTTSRPDGSMTPAGGMGVASGRGVIVYYFSGKVRCSSCRKIEALSRKAVEGGFAREMADGRLRFVAVNVDEPLNRHFVDEYRLDSSALVVVDVRNGKPAAWRNLRDVWTLLDDEPRFLEYVRGNVAPGLSGA